MMTPTSCVLWECFHRSGVLVVVDSMDLNGGHDTSQTIWVASTSQQALCSCLAHASSCSDPDDESSVWLCRAFAEQGGPFRLSVYLQCWLVCQPLNHDNAGVYTCWIMCTICLCYVNIFCICYFHYYSTDNTVTGCAVCVLTFNFTAIHVIMIQWSSTITTLFHRYTIHAIMIQWSSTITTLLPVCSAVQWIWIIIIWCLYKLLFYTSHISVNHY